jgi:enoyl-[acyl-carrier protein] reductase / trans-2-enoyl-CoA reductase (NAD+)
MELSLPRFQYRFVAAMGHVIHPGNFHPVGTQRAASEAVARIAARSGAVSPGAGGRWLVVGASGGFGTAARIVLGVARGAHTVGVSLDAAPNPESSNKVRKIGSPGWHRNALVEARLRERGLTAVSVAGDAFAEGTIAASVAAVRERLGGPLDGIVWALAAPRATHPVTGETIASALKPLGAPVTIKAFTGREEKSTEPSRVAEVEIPPGSPEEAIGTVFVMGGEVVERWVHALRQAELLAPGFTLLTISYRGNPLNSGIYRHGLIGLAKADLELRTRMLDLELRRDFGGRAIAVEGPAVVTEASGGIPGVPFYMAHLLDVLGDRFEDPVDSMARMFAEHFGEAGPQLDGEGLLRMDDRELQADVQAQMQRRFEAARAGEAFPGDRYDAFMRAYAATRGFDVPGVDYDAAFDTDAVCDPAAI